MGVWQGWNSIPQTSDTRIVLSIGWLKGPLPLLAGLLDGVTASEKKNGRAFSSEKTHD